VIAAIAALSAAGLMAVAAANATASATPRRATVVNPYSPAYKHAYRLGVVPTRGQLGKMRGWAKAHHNATSGGSGPLSYGGGVDGIGVTTDKEKVYLVFWGSQWGTQATNGSGDTTLSGDKSGEAPYAQEFFKGLGTNSELWSGVMTQYCEGVASGSTSCPASNASHVAYPAGGNVLAGVWVDESAAAPATASGHQIGVEAMNAANHFGNTSAALNRDAQYVIASPTGTNPDNWLTQGFCAWHDYNGDTTLSGGAVSSGIGDFSFTNLPYITDAGASCGANFVNSSGPLDGVSIVEGHEYAETVTDQNPAGGWVDTTGYENGDKCAWITPGTSGGSFDLTLGTGKFAVQTTYSNDGATCDASHAIVANGGSTGNTVTVTSPGNQTSTVGTAVSLQISGTDSASGQTLSYSATGLPAGLSISSSGLITGTPTTAGTSSVTVTATDTTSASGSASFSWTVNPVPGGNAISNGTFETGTLSGWTGSGSAFGVTTTSPHTGTYAALLGKTTNTSGTSSIAQTFTAPSGDSHLTFWYRVSCPDNTRQAYATATLRDTSGGSSRTVLARTCTNTGAWVQVSVIITAGHTYTLTLSSHDDNDTADATYTKYDDVATS
jgi:serine protease